MSKKNKKEEFVDDGRTIYNMDIDGMPHRQKKDPDGLYLTRAERLAVIKAALLHFGPIVLGIILCFTIAMILIYFWLR